MMKLKHLLYLCGLVVMPAFAQKADYRIVPLPQSIQLKSDGAYNLSPNVVITYASGNDKMQRNAQFLSEYIQQITGMKLKTIAADKPMAGAINLTLQKGDVNAENYTLTIDKDGVTISSTGEAGVFYGIQTLRKSLPAEQCAKVELPFVTIKDAPRFEYRGTHFDTSRHYFPVDFLKTYIDILALHNVNRFHWHITDDQGWRLEIKRYPELTRKGAWRKETVIGTNTGVYDGTPYGGYYTQAECREIVEYAAHRYITVVPEIDMPGHMQGALAAFPELGCTGGPYETWTIWGVSDDVLCAGNPKTLEFIRNVLEEVMDIFPSALIHVGGDECPKTRWKECPLCQAKIKELGLVADKKLGSAENQLQSYIIREAEKFVNSNGRQIIGWDEILEGGIAPNAAIMSWRGNEGGVEAARLHHDVVMTPIDWCYLNFGQAKDSKTEPVSFNAYLPIEQVYTFEPVPAELSADEAKHIKGAQANLWTEYIYDGKQAEHMLLPRLAAICETQWMSASSKDYADFQNRLQRLLALYTQLNYDFYNPAE